MKVMRGKNEKCCSFFKSIPKDRRFMESKFVTMWDLNVGVNLNIYGKVFKLVDCDHFTRHFLSCQGVTVPAQIPIPTR